MQTIFHILVAFLVTKPYSSPIAAILLFPSESDLKMTLVILALCTAAALTISRPIVRAFNL